MLWRIETMVRPHVADVVGRRVAGKIESELNLKVDRVRLIRVFTVAGLSRDQVEKVVEVAALHDPVLQTASLLPLGHGFDWAVEVGFRPGVTDNEGRTARETIALVLGLTGEAAAELHVFTSQQYLIDGALSEAEVGRICRDLLANDLIQRVEYKDAKAWAAHHGFAPKSALVDAKAEARVETVDLAAMDDEALLSFSRENTLALSLTEMRAIRDHFQAPETASARKAAGLPALPTDAEIEVLAQTWSEHCKHKIFTAKIDYRDKEAGTSETIDSLFKTYIQGSTKAIREKLGQDDFCLSVFTDNAGVVAFTDELSVCIKVETHNSPSALDPYGGALTGIVGVNRDPMGTGMGANLLCNTDVFCFASPFFAGELPPRLLHPRRVLEGVREGVEHGGNKSGIPTVNGSLVFDERYLGKPLVFCGTVGTMPATLHGQPSYQKKALPGDAVVMTGGRIGKDGIHGATFSSEELHEGSPATAVQIGDPITQKRMYDFIMRARDAGLYNAITDNGAGGLSSSVGEMARDSGGCELDLSKAPLKYPGLRPWEILLSEAQERMTLAVPQDNLAAFLAMAVEMDVEASVLGRFTDSGYFQVGYGQTPVARLSMDFLHDGAPQLELEAVWEKPVREPRIPDTAGLDQGALLTRMLSRLNICSKEYVVRQYDHEVKGGSVVKPMVGVKRDGPSDAGVIRPDLSRPEALVVSHGICPKYSDLDAYQMMACAIDEAVRNAVAVGADPDRIAGVDNFCWCDPVQSEKTPDGRYKLAQLVRANKALSDVCQAFGVPCVSGKDSMKNDYTGGGVKISIPPTVLYSALGRLGDAGKAVTSDFKKPGNLIYLLGPTRAELGGSELESELGALWPQVPVVDAAANKRRYTSLHAAMQQRLAASCHDLSDGGLAVAVAEMAIGGRLGAAVTLDAVPGATGLDATTILYSESAGRLLVEVAPGDAAAFEALFAGQDCARIGAVGADTALTVSLAGNTLIKEEISNLAKAFTKTLAW